LYVRDRALDIQNSSNFVSSGIKIEVSAILASETQNKGIQIMAKNNFTDRVKSIANFPKQYCVLLALVEISQRQFQCEGNIYLWCDSC